jgi:hypothetical protein
MQYVLCFGIIIYGIIVALKQNTKNNRIQEENDRLEVEIRGEIKELTCLYK